MESARVAWRRQKGGAAENEGKDPQPMPTIRLRQCEQAPSRPGIARTTPRSSSKNCSETERAPW
jgi:hypothetical protein